MRRFIHLISGLDVVVEKDPLAEFFATVPALPGCGSQGENVYDTLSNLDDAIMTVLHVLGEDDPGRLQQLCGAVTRFETAEVAEADTTGTFTTIVTGSFQEEAIT